MNTFQKMSTRLILQGETAISQGTPVADLKFITSIPTSCTVLTLFSEEKKISVLSHIDDYTSVENVFFTINEQMQSEFSFPLQSINFKAKVMGGSEEDFSARQQQKVISLLETNKILYDKIDIEENSKKERPQIIMNVATGKIDLLYGSKKDYRIEYLQKREYHFFNRYQLDKEYKGLSGEKIPDFKTILAIRSLFTLPEFKMNDVSEESIDYALALEDSGKLELPITSWKRSAILSEEKARQALINLVKSYNQQLLTVSLEKNDYNLLLRQSCSCHKYINLTTHLVEHRFILNVDILSEGKTSGSSLKIAKKHNNSEVIKLLKSALK